MPDDSQPPSPALKRFEGELERLLSLLDDPTASATAIEHASDQLCVLIDELERAVPEPALPRGRDRARQLNALARDLAGSRLQELAVQLALLRAARREPPPTGEHCDIDG